MESVEKIDQRSNSKVFNSTLIVHSRYEHLLAGLSGGVTSTLILHPLDLLKIRFAVNDGKNYSLNYRGITNALTTIFKEEGFRGLYRGATPSTIGSGVSWGLYFYFYNALKSGKQNGDVDIQLTTVQQLLAASEAGLMTLICTNPIWVAKTRLCLEMSQPTSGVQSEKYRGMTDCLVKLYQKEGVQGLYRGFLPAVFGVSHGAIQFLIYEKMKQSYCNYRALPISTKLGSLEYLTFAAVSKLFASAVTYPYQVVKSRLQNQFYSYNGTWDCIKKIWTLEGYHGFYKGLGTNLIRVVPATMITFITYENVSHFLLRKD